MVSRSVDAVGAAFYVPNKSAIERAFVRLPHLTLNKWGLWFQEGEEITHARTVELLHKSFLRVNDSEWAVRTGEEMLPVILEDVPYFISEFDQDREKIKLLQNTWVDFLPDTLQVGAENILYVDVQFPNGTIERAKFLKAAYYEISKLIEEKNSAGRSVEYLLHFRGRYYKIAISAQGK